MKLGGVIFEKFRDPREWIATLKKAGYSAAYYPLDDAALETDIRACAVAAADAGIVIAEVGAWSNPLSTNEKERREKIALCKKRLAVADLVGAKCCVNIAGSRGTKWDGPCAEDLTPATFDLVVETVREIIDAVKPSRTFYTLEPMPWMYPDSPDSYLRLIAAIDRKSFAVHLDPVNMINCPSRCFFNGEFLRECFRKLGPSIKSCHAKDVVISEKLTTRIEERRVGLGTLDYGVYLSELDKLAPDTPLMIEHLETEEEYRLSAEHIRKVAVGAGIRIR
jgi:sugar phosphate isomerase/epimerase